MTTLVVGATGATGRLLVAELLARGEQVKVIARSPHKLPPALAADERLSILHAPVLELSDAALAAQVQGCTAVASCLGHTLTLRGIYGPPRRLVADAMRRLCGAIRANPSEHPTKVVLMSSTGVRNPARQEPQSVAERGVLALLRRVLPPQADNEAAASYLRGTGGPSDSQIEWAVVRPDTLINADAVTEYAVHTSPTSSPLFKPGKTSRINVGHFMARLITEEATWQTWRGQMPVLYNSV